MIEVRIIKIDINTGEIQYQTSLYPDSTSTLNPQPRLLEIDKDDPVSITTVFIAERTIIDVNGVFYGCSSQALSTIWTVCLFIFLFIFLFLNFYYCKIEIKIICKQKR